MTLDSIDQPSLIIPSNGPTGNRCLLNVSLNTVAIFPETLQKPNKHLVLAFNGRTTYLYLTWKNLYNIESINIYHINEFQISS